jgi:sugar phosphate permease
MIPPTDKGATKPDATPPYADGATAAARHAAHRDWRGRLPFFYGWLIVVGSLLVLGLTYSVMYAFSVFYVALLEEFKWGRGETAGVYSVFMIVTGIGAVGAGMLADRFGPGRVISWGGVVLAAGLLICSRISALWQFYLAFGVLVAFGVSIAGWTPCVTMLNRWFSVRLGLALGIASGGIGVGILAVVPGVQLVINSMGWRAAFIVLAGVVVCGLVPVGHFLLRGRPEDLGQHQDGFGSRKAPRPSAKPRVRKQVQVVDKAWAERDWTVASAAKTARLWLLCAVKLAGGVATHMVFVHQVVYLVDGGYDRVLAASVVGLIGLISVGGKVMWGWAADNIGREMTYTLGCVAMAIAVGLLALTSVYPSTSLLYVYALVFAIGYAVSAPLWPLVTADLYAGRKFGSIYGFITVFSGFGNAVGAWLGGVVFDITGSYAIAFVVAVVGKLVSAAVLWVVAPRKVRRVQRTMSA